MNEKKVLPLIGQEIRRLRTARGMTLEQLAARAGTSASALHRYEAGWDRFELSTLRRISAALGVRLEVRLREGEGESQRLDRVPRANELVQLLAPLFWDKQLTTRDLEAHPLWVLGRVLMYGDRRQVDASRARFGDDMIRRAIRARGVDARTRRYWELVLEDVHASPGA